MFRMLSNICDLALTNVFRIYQLLAISNLSRPKDTQKMPKNVELVSEYFEKRRVRYLQLFLV